MKTTIKWLFFIAIVIGCIYIGFRWWLPTKIIAIHENRYLIVENFPVLKANREKWWRKNESYLKSEYNFSSAYSDGSYTVTIFDIGHGYEEEIPDRDWLLPGGSTDHLLCFDKIISKHKCIRKDNILMLINKNGEGEVTFDSY
ncbi:MAG: DUF943 family protein [Enterobacteriaceae bacterium]|jgi:hypothetical protein|nr:DUF943 family protein [Enterobacteriaceae bacterium]